MARFQVALLILQLSPLALGDACNGSIATSLPPFGGPKIVRRGQGEMVWSFAAPAQDVAIVLTPSNSSVNPDMRLYVASDTTTCQPVQNSQEIGADYMRVEQNLTERWNVSTYFLHVLCRDQDNCQYHLALSKLEEWEEISDGEERSAIAYHGVPVHYKFVCQLKCRQALEADLQRRVTFSAWPRDASSTRHLSLLVRYGDYPTTKAEEHLNASRGWFSGEVVTTIVRSGTYYITVLKRHGLSPLPFVISVSVPETMQTLQLGKPTFGTVRKGTASFYKFYVAHAQTDIEVYLTKLDGDPDCAVSHHEENEHPTLAKSQWHSTKIGDDEITIPPDDPERKQHRTGWFHVGVHSLAKDSTFSIIAFAERHIDKADDTEQGKDGQMIEWTQLWLGLPQALAAQPGRPANFLYYSQLATPKLFVNIEALEGNKPDVCVQNCGGDPHRCPWISLFAGETTRASAPAAAVSFCSDGSLRGYSGDEQATILQPCTKCWYTILVSSASKRSRFKIQLGAEGRAHLLVEGEPFKGHADSGDACSLLAYDLAQSTVDARADATLQIAMTPIYGDPAFDVRKGLKEEQLLFNSSEAGRDSWQLKLDAKTAKSVAGTYYIRVCAGLQHAQFRIAVTWDRPLLKPGSDAKKLGVGMLNDGEVQMGTISANKHNIYLFIPASVEHSPSIRVSVTSTSGHCQLYVLAPKTGSEDKVKETMREFLRSPEAVADWKTAEKDQSEILISPSDAKYIAPTASNLYMFMVAGSDDTDFEIAASTGGLEELPTTGMPLRGQVQAGEYRRYRVSIAEAGRHLSLQLTAENGDCDLYVHIIPDVSSESFVLRSESLGSDAIFVDAYGELNQMHCSEKTIRTSGECVYFVAVKGVSARSDFQLEAIVPAAAPIPLTMSAANAVTLPPGGVQYFYALLQTVRATTFEVAVRSGALKHVTLKVMPLKDAKRPNASNLGEVGVSGTFFAGVWSLVLEPTRLLELCNISCAALIILRGDKELTTCTASFQSRQNSSVSAPDDSCALLEAGVPSRGNLVAAERACYNLRISDRSDIAITVSPLTDCRPEVQVTQKSGITKALPADVRLGYVSTILRHGDVQPGILTLEVSAEEVCQFDVRAQLITGETVQVAPGVGQLTVLTLDAPAFFTTSQSAGANFFSYTSQIQTPKETAAREFLQAEVMTLSGEVSVDCAYHVVPAEHSVEKKRNFIQDALQAMHPAQPDLSKGSSQIYACRGMHEACGEAFSCLLIIRVVSKPGWEADFVVTVVDRRTRQVLLPGLPVESCVGQLCSEGGTSVRYQLFINNPSTKVNLRLSCQGHLQKERCLQVLLSADARIPLPSTLADRAYTPHEAVTAGYMSMEIKASSQDESHPGRCRVPCVLTVQVELRPGEYAAVDFQLEAVFEDAYSVILDGGKPLAFVANPGKAEYFLFDTRQHTPMSTLAVGIPYDVADPDMNLVKMYLLGCDRDGSRPLAVAGGSQGKAAVMPSQQTFSQRGVINSRWQLMAMLEHGSEGESCHGVSVAVISYRVKAAPLTIRGYGWHPGTPLMLGDQLEGALDGSHSFSYAIVPDEDVEDIVLDLEVCTGDVQLQTGLSPVGHKAGGQNAGHVLRGGVARLRMRQKMNEWIQISSVDGRYARYVISVQDAKDATWLDAGNLQRSVLVTQQAQAVQVDWQSAQLFGQGHDQDPHARYEVFYGRTDKIAANISTPCGMYLEHSLRSMKMTAISGGSSAVLQDLHPGLYTVNIVARSLATGHVTAYQPWTGEIRYADRTFAEAEEASARFLSNWPVTVLLLVAFLGAWQFCRSNRAPRPFSLELPSWRSSAQHYYSLDGREIGGRYMPPAL